MHHKNIITAGQKLEPGNPVLIMLHGRGSNANDILSLASYLNVSRFSLLAPQATNNSWYPNSFLAPPQQNQPWLGSALDIIKYIVDDVDSKGVPAEQIYLAGFSQGACLALEYVTRNASKYGGVAAFTGGLIGDKIYNENYKGDFENMPVFIGTSDPDPHVPVERVYATTNILKNMNAVVTEKVYSYMGHTINEDEIALANKIVFARKQIL